MRHRPLPRHATKIVATLGPASNTPELLEQMIDSKVSVVRLNFSHGTAQDHIDRASMVHEAAQRRPRCRHPRRPAGAQDPHRDVHRRQIWLEPGGISCSTPADRAGRQRAVGLAYKDLPRDVKAGDSLLLNDGLIMLKVEARGEAQHTTCGWAASCRTTRA